VPAKRPAPGFYRRVGKDIGDARLEDAQLRSTAKAGRDGAGAGHRAFPLAVVGSRGAELEGPIRRFHARVSAALLALRPDEAPVVAYDLVSVDRAMEWVRLEAGRSSRWISRARLPQEGIRAARTRHAADESLSGGMLSIVGPTTSLIPKEGRWYERVPDLPGTIHLASQKRWRRLLGASADASLVDVGDGRRRARVHEQDEHARRRRAANVVESLARVRRTISSAGHWQRRSAPPSRRGADLSWVMRMARNGKWKELEAAVELFQSCSMSLRAAPFRSSSLRSV